uniref:Uncharacterized protein n=1 Tax=Solanum tuberosum TaxID=4113 RepID=M1DST6_SOLTU
MTTTRANVRRNEEDNIDQEVPPHAPPQASIDPLEEKVTNEKFSFTLSCILSTFQVLMHTCATSSHDVGSGSQHPDHA